MFALTLLQMVLLLVTAAYIFYKYMTANYNYWKERGVIYIKPQFFYGSTKEIVTTKIDIGKGFQKYYNQFKNERYFGTFSMRNPSLLLRDPELIKFVMTKNFQYFVNRDNLPKLKHDYLMNHLFNMKGEDWREMRRKLTPTFTSGKMKKMFTLMAKCAEQLRLHVGTIAETQGTINTKDLAARYTTDVIASCAFGLDVKSLDDRDCEFYRMGQLIFVPSRWQILYGFLLRSYPKLFDLLGMRIINKELEKYLYHLVQTTVDYREKNNVNRNDFLDLLIKVKQNKSLEDKNINTNVQKNYGSLQVNEEESGLTIEEMASQTFVFFAAGFETGASTMTFCLYELARHQDIQERLCREVNDVLSTSGGDLTYEAIQQMTYMDQVINETLRLYASLPMLSRACVESCKLGDTDLVIEKGIKVIIPTYAIHHDPEYYPDPDTFDPERFTEEEMKKRHPYTHLPFGEGPRNCIGMRFGKMQVKMGLSSLLPRFLFTLSPDTPVPVEISPKMFITTPSHPIQLIVSKRTD